jgi:integrase
MRFGFQRDSDRGRFEMINFKSKLAPVIKEYLEVRKAMGYSDIHEKHLASFDDYCREYYPGLETITKESARGWVKYEIARGKGGMYNKISSVRFLARYIGNGAYVLPTTTVPGKPKCTPYILTDDELSRLFIIADTNVEGTTDSSVKAMFPTLLRLLYTCGLRPGEARLIKRDNINFDTGEIFIEKTKQRKDRIVVMSNDMLLQCRKYDVIRSITAPQGKYFFARYDGTPIPDYRLSLVFRSCWRRANADVPVNMLPKVRPYDMRHRFASAVLQKWLDEGRDLYAMLPYLRAYMGHGQISETAYYIHLLPENLINSSGVDWSGIDTVSPEVSIWNG